MLALTVLHAALSAVLGLHPKELNDRLVAQMATAPRGL